MSPPARILIVEDEEVLAKNLKSFLGRRAPDVRVVPDGEEAVRLMDTFAPDLVVLDYGLPGVDGLRTYGELVRAGRRQPPCVMITGYFTEEIAESARENGINHVLCKPFSFAELQDVVERSAAEVHASEIPDLLEEPEPRISTLTIDADRRRGERRQVVMYRAGERRSGDRRAQQV